VKGFQGVRLVGNSVIYKNFLYACVTIRKEKKKLLLIALSLESKRIEILLYLFIKLDIGLGVARSIEEEYLSSLFMNENESDIKFKIQDKVFPAHKKVLMEKSRFFSNLFKSKRDLILNGSKIRWYDRIKA